MTDHKITMRNGQERWATLIGEVERIKFYEHPDYGDEAGLLAVYNGKTVQTDFGDLPEPWDIKDHGGQAEFMAIYG